MADGNQGFTSADDSAVPVAHFLGAIDNTSLDVRQARAEKQALDLLAAWPICTTDQMAGLMCGVTCGGANQVGEPFPR